MKLVNFLDDTENVTGSGKNVTSNEANRLHTVQGRTDEFVTGVTTVTGNKEDIYVADEFFSIFEDEKEKNNNSCSHIGVYLQNTGNSGNTGNIHESFSEQPVTKAVTKAVINDDVIIRVIEYGTLAHVTRPPLPRELWRSGLADFGQAWQVWQELRKDYLAAMGKNADGYYIDSTIERVGA